MADPCRQSQPALLPVSTWSHHLPTSVSLPLLYAALVCRSDFCLGDTLRYPCDPLLLQPPCPKKSCVPCHQLQTSSVTAEGVLTGRIPGAGDRNRRSNRVPPGYNEVAAVPTSKSGSMTAIKTTPPLSHGPAFLNAPHRAPSCCLLCASRSGRSAHGLGSQSVTILTKSATFGTAVPTVHSFQRQ